MGVRRGEKKKKRPQKKSSLLRTPVKTLGISRKRRLRVGNKGYSSLGSETDPPQASGPARVSRDPARADGGWRAANCQLRPEPGQRLMGAATRYKQRVSPPGCTHRRAARPAGPAGSEVGREGDASCGLRKRGIPLDLAPTWASRLPSRNSGSWATRL